MDAMEAIKATFFQECDELLGELEVGLLALQSGTGDQETVNGVFRAVHSVKGGAGAFGLDSLVRFAHVFETTLDEIRSERLEATPAVVASLLRAADVLSDLVSAAKLGQPGPEQASAELIDELQRITQDQAGGPTSEAAAEPAELDFGFRPLSMAIDLEPAPATATSAWTIAFTPKGAMYRNANDALLLIRELERMGEVSVDVDASRLPSLDGFDPETPSLTWIVSLRPAEPVDEAAIREAFEFVDGDCDLTVTAADAVAPVSIAPSEPAPAEDTEALLARLLAEATMPSEPAAATKAAAPTPPPPPAANTEALVQTTIRVDLERVDRLIDLVGELVINQAMLAQRVFEVGLARSSTIAVGLDDLEQLTRDIQDSVMAIRAQPVKSVFQRMPRLVREVGAATGKSVRLVTEGEGTEVDKTVIERLSDPITHMIRNAIDHGLERPDERIASGKPETGTVKLSALHRSGRIVIEVADDGRGINREKVRAVAVERGLIEPDAVLTDDEVDNLIFAPGFSTASAVSDISGRGVGMDVVKRSIQALGGRIVITSRPGQGSTFTLSLPLTLAVLDGMVVSVGEQTLVVPISVIVETLLPKPSDIRRLGPDRYVVAVRGSHVPLVDVDTALGWGGEKADKTDGVVILVESEVGGLVALRFDAIQGQRQVVIKSLEQNYQQVEGVAAATILGNGRVALIIDVDGVIAAQRRAPVTRLSQLAEAS